MTSVTLARPLVSTLFPENKIARLAVQLGFALAGTLLLILSAKTRVVLGPVDMSLQTLAIFIIAASFGLRLGVATLLLYMAEGAVGLPVFQGTPEKGIGLLYMMGTTGGYLAGFVVAAAIIGWAADRGWHRSVVKFLGALVVAEIAILGLGFAWLATITGAETAWAAGVVPFIIRDAIKLGIAATLMPALWSFGRKAD